MSLTYNWSPEDSVALRDFFTRVPPHKLNAIMQERCPAKITEDVLLKHTGEAVGRIACMRSGWEQYHQSLIALAEPTRPSPGDSLYKDMS